MILSKVSQFFVLAMVATSLLLSHSAAEAQTKTKKTVRTSVQKKAEEAKSGDSWNPLSKMEEFSGKYEHEVMSALTLGSYVTTPAGSSTNTSINAQGSWSKFMKEQIQAGVEVAYSNNSYAGSTSSSSVEAMAFGVYNFDEDMTESMYAKAGLGMFTVQNASGSNESKFGFMFGGGRRFPLYDRINYAPEVRIYKKGDANPSFAIYFINLSLQY